ncbi:MAG: TonB-dependent receptor [Saprospiraceae bacterium]|nr:TonB-dependent receptor [Saprospiraceae bacterium]
MRASVGRGLRTASIFAENIGIFASNRAIFVEGQIENNPYQLDAEVAWNYGWNATQDIELWQRPSTLTLDIYHTNFNNQIVVDYDFNAQQIRFYNLQGRSFSTSLQAQWDIELLERWDVRLAYRYNDVQTDYRNERLRKPFVSNHIAFINTAYETINKWKFDATVNWQSSKRIPSTATNPHEFHISDQSPNFFLFNAQVSKEWNEKLEVYVGAENLLNFQQEMPIISSENPSSPYFDASLIWGPIFGRNVYMGLRYRLK